MQSYPASTLVLVKGKWYVQVTIPINLRPFFNNRTQERVSIRTSDKGQASRQQHYETAKIYEKFDLATRELDPLVVAANKVVVPLGHNSLNSDAWGADNIEHSAQQVRMSAGSILSVRIYNDDGTPCVTAEDGMIIDRLQSEVEPAFWDFEEQLEVRRRAVSQCRLTVSELAAKYWPTKTFNREKTANAYKVGVQKFVDYCGDALIATVDKKLAKNFVAWLAARQAYNTVQRDVGSVRMLFDFAADQEFIPVNPFNGIRTKGQGAAAKQGRPLRPSQLKKLFEMRMTDQDRLCLSILAATGMRLDEATLLTYEDIRSESGIRYFDFTGSNKIVKNMTAKREVPIHPELDLPSEGSGRLFDYRIDADGKAQAAASKQLMKYIYQIRDDPNDTQITIHSLRHAFKDLMRDASVPNIVQDSIIGHKEAGQGAGYGSGTSLQTMASWMEKLDLSFLR